MNKLNQLGITVGKDNKAEIVFDSLFPSFLTVKYKKPSDYISTYWEAFKKHPEGNNNLNGKIFEYILGLHSSLLGARFYITRFYSYFEKVHIF